MIFGVSFRIIVKKYHTNWLSVIHFTTGSDHGVYGYRIPAVWIAPNRKQFGIWCDVSGNINNVNYVDFSFGMPYDITITQTPFPRRQLGRRGFGMLWYEIIVNGSPFVSVANHQPRNFSNVKEYLSDPWYPAFTSDFGYVSNLKICNLNICM